MLHSQKDAEEEKNTIVHFSKYTWAPLKRLFRSKGFLKFTYPLLKLFLSSLVEKVIIDVKYCFNFDFKMLETRIPY